MKEIRDIPTAEQFENELNRLRYRENFTRAIISTITSLIVITSIAVLVSTMFVPVLRVTGASMTPTLQNDELVIGVKSSKYKCGDIVAFYCNNKVLLKRVIGTPGDVIDISEDGKVYLNGDELDEPYVNELAVGECDLDLPYQVPESRIFVMGDHRAVSIDSRSTAVGCVAEENIVGKIVYRALPFNRRGFLNDN